MLEGVEVLGQVLGLGATDEVPVELGGVGARQGVADAVGQLDHGDRAEATVEVVVEQHLRGAAHGVDGDRAGHADQCASAADGGTGLTG